jgi:hypothetical protein
MCLRQDQLQAIELVRDCGYTVDYIEEENCVVVTDGYEGSDWYLYGQIDIVLRRMIVQVHARPEDIAKVISDKYR